MHWVRAAARGRLDNLRPKEPEKFHQYKECVLMAEAKDRRLRKVLR